MWCLVFQPLSFPPYYRGLFFFPSLEIDLYSLCVLIHLDLLHLSRSSVVSLPLWRSLICSLILFLTSFFLFFWFSRVLFPLRRSFMSSRAGIFSFYAFLKVRISPAFFIMFRGGHAPLRPYGYHSFITSTNTWTARRFSVLFTPRAHPPSLLSSLFPSMPPWTLSLLPSLRPFLPSTLSASLSPSFPPFLHQCL